LKPKWYNSKAIIRVWALLILLSVIIFFAGLQGMLGSLFPPMDFLRFISANRLSAFVRAIIIYTSKRVTIDLLLVGLGIWGMYVAVKRGLYSVLTVLKPSNRNDIVGNVYEKIRLTRGPKIAVLSDAAGITAILNGLKKYTSNIDALILPTDNNIRSTLTALAGTKSLNKLFGYRFEKTGLEGFNFGDLYIKAMKDVTGDISSALKESANVFSLAGGIYPLVLSPIKTEFKTTAGRRVLAEETLIKEDLKVSSVRLGSAPCKVNEKALAIIKQADAVIIGPGSFYASILPSLLIKGVPEAIFASRGLKIFIVNLMTKKYEPAKPTVSGQIRTLLEYAGEPVLDVAVVNTSAVPEDILVRYRKYHSESIVIDEEKLLDLEVIVSRRNMIKITEDGSLRHDPQSLGRALIKIISI